MCPKPPGLAGTDSAQSKTQLGDAVAKLSALREAGSVVRPATHTNRLYLMYLTGGHPTFPISKASQPAQSICLVPAWYWHMAKTCIQSQETENCPSAASTSQRTSVFRSRRTLQQRSFQCRLAHFFIYFQRFLLSFVCWLFLPKISCV